MLVPGSRPKIKYEVKNYLTYLEHALEETAKKFDLTVKLNQEITADSLKSKGFDSVVVSVGGSAVSPKLPGIDQANVIQAIDLFRKPDLAGEGKNVVVIGAGAVGCEAAHFLASELGKTVTIVEMLPNVMAGLCTANRGHLIHELENLGVAIWNCTKLKSVEGKSVKVDRNVSSTVPDPFVTWSPILLENISNPFAKPIKEEIAEQTLTVDLVVLAMGLRSGRAFYEACVTAHVAPEIVQLGDTFQIGRVFEAVKSGSMVGRNI
jgi:2-enoate reductase